jgi:hypothetical protein
MSPDVIPWAVLACALALVVLALCMGEASDLSSS